MDGKINAGEKGDVHEARAWLGESEGIGENGKEREEGRGRGESGGEGVR